ncbi:hypothetical protein C2G38_2242256 [Gigaspora rosea]|uniref:Uncharacterized protein n=1 Tax=Gigaspora rosea TaxID=44941 RepID=A0A397VQ24_9GLOM|nr:hypothetical protein C2G38_2242256 [Gigaspora rosea]
MTKRKKVITPLAPKTSASKMLAPKPLAPKPLVNNPLSSEPLIPVIHPTPLTNLTNNFSSQQWQFLNAQLQTDSLNEITSKYNKLTSDTASLVLKEHTKVSIQQKWNTLLQKYHDIKDKIASTKEVVIQNNCEFFDNMNIYLRRNPSVTVPITSDSICGIKRKVQESTEDQDDDDNETKKRKSTHSENKSNIEKIQGLIKEQTEAITKIIRDQYLHASEMQQKHHNEQMNIFKQFLLKF